MASLSGKVTIVTGASRGIGRAIAERLARDGASVVVNDRDNAALAAEVVAGIEATVTLAMVVQADMAKIGDIRRLFRAAMERFGRLDVVVSNAAVFQPRPVAEVTEAGFDPAFAVNGKGMFFVL